MQTLARGENPIPDACELTRLALKAEWDGMRDRESITPQWAIGRRFTCPKCAAVYRVDETPSRLQLPMVIGSGDKRFRALFIECGTPKCGKLTRLYEFPNQVSAHYRIDRDMYANGGVFPDAGCC